MVAEYNKGRFNSAPLADAIVPRTHGAFGRVKDRESIHIIGAGLSYQSRARDAAHSHFWKLKTPFGIRALGIGIALVNVVFILVLILGEDLDDFMLLLTMFSMAVVGIFGVFLALSYIYLSIDAGYLRTGLWPISKRVVPLAILTEHFYVKDVRPSSFGRVGFRKAPGKKTAYLWGRGPGLEIRTASGESITVVFEKADQAVRILDETTESQ